MGKRGPRPKPSALRRLEGGNRGRRPLPVNEPQPSRLAGVPPPPPYLSGYALTEWERVIGDLCATGVYANVDQTMLAAYCMAYRRWRLAEDLASRLSAQDPTSHGVLMKTESGNVVQNPAVGAVNAARRDMLRLAAEFGLTPSGRVAPDNCMQDIDDPVAQRYGL